VLEVVVAVAVGWGLVVDGGFGEGEGDGDGGRDGGISQGVASAWEDMISSMEASPPSGMG
jgi:hypothetical protein